MTTTTTTTTTINFTRGVPANDSFPTADLVDAARSIFASHGAAILQYGPSAGFQPLMPTYRGQLNEEQLFQLVEYIKSLPPRDAESDAS